MLKAELESKLKAAELELKELKTNIDKGLKDVIDNYCGDSWQPIEEFCDTIGFEFPTKVVSFMINYGEDICSACDGTGQDIKIEEVFDEFPFIE